ncbi:MAG: thermonuclease family protein [Acidimicrobiales bacterium]
MAIVDGDTLDLDIEGVTERVRLLGIDTPESVSSTTPDQCFGHEATEALRGLLPIETQVDLERDLEARDRYGRLLLYLHRSSDGLFVNEWLLDGGFANAVSYAPNDRLAARFSRTEADARARGAGLWSRCDGPDQPLE